MIFADLNLIGSSAGGKIDFSALGGFLENTIKPDGPYFIVLWTLHPDEASELQQFLLDRLTTPQMMPFGVFPLAKSKYIVDGELKEPKKLMTAIYEIISEFPELSVLFDWENRVFDATGNSISAIAELTPTKDPETRRKELGQILAVLGCGAVGNINVAHDPFRALNEAMTPVLVDRLTNLPVQIPTGDHWENVVTADKNDLTENQASKLNAMIHIASLERDDVYERGVVIELPNQMIKKFKEEFNVSDEDAASKNFFCKDYQLKDNKFRWILIQVQAACDYAQRRPGSLPCYLGLELPCANVPSNKIPPQALWCSPSFEHDEMIKQLHINAGFPVSMSIAEFTRSSSLYRLRESILNYLTYHLHSHGARPGIISFRSK